MLHLIGNPILVAVRDGIDIVLARADENHAGIGTHSHVARIGHDRIKIDLESGRKLDLLEIFPDGICLPPFLCDGPRLSGSRALERREFLQIAGRRLSSRLSEARGRECNN